MLIRNMVVITGLATSGFAAADIREERAACLANRLLEQEELTGAALVDVVRGAQSGETLLTVLVDIAVPGQAPDGQADRMFVLQTLKMPAGFRGAEPVKPHETVGGQLLVSNLLHRGRVNPCCSG